MPALRKELNIACDMDDILTESINLETAEMLTQVLKLKNNQIEGKENHNGWKKLSAFEAYVHQLGCCNALDVTNQYVICSDMNWIE